MGQIKPGEVQAAFLYACRAELGALKPGNVHIHAAGHGMQVADFERAAEAAAPIIADRSLGVGERVRRGVEASFAAAGCNTNLGILLLSAPLAAAAERQSPDRSLKVRLGAVLSGLDEADAAHVYEAIRHANPGGLGRSELADVSHPPDVSLLDAMALAAPRDRIARAYVTGFEDIFEFGLPALDDARAAEPTESLAVTALHMAYLAQFPDSHIARKYGRPAAEGVRREAEDLCRDLQTEGPQAAFSALVAFDHTLKSRGLNPGTTADFVVTTLFAGHLSAKLAA